jgi:hypothetical protein
VCPAEAGAEPKVCELDVSVGVDENVVWLDVPVDESHLMHALYRAHQLTDVKSAQGKNALFLKYGLGGQTIVNEKT